MSGPYYVKQPDGPVHVLSPSGAVRGSADVGTMNGDQPMNIWCCGCGKDTEARLTNGTEIYPHRPDLVDLPFWRCDTCNNHVGCHHKTNDPTRPLGVIPTLQIRRERNRIHDILDPLWRHTSMSRQQVYKRLAQMLGVNEYHTADILSTEEARRVYAAVKQISKECENKQ